MRNASHRTSLCKRVDVAVGSTCTNVRSILFTSRYAPSSAYGGVPTSGQANFVSMGTEY